MAATGYKIDLHGVPKPDKAPSPSGFCQKLETVLRASGFTDYQYKFNYPHQGPKGKVPWIVLHAPSDSTTPPLTIADSHFITGTLVEKGIIPDLDAGLTPAQRADSRAWQAYTEELLYPAVVRSRWNIPANFTNIKRVFDDVPWPIRWLVVWFISGRVSLALWGHGVARHSKEEVLSIMARWVSDLRDHFVERGGPFFHGDKPTYIDAILYGFLSNILGADYNAEFSLMVLTGNGAGKGEGGEVLRDYVKRCTKLWYPEYEQLLQVVE